VTAAAERGVTAAADRGGTAAAERSETAPDLLVLLHERADAVPPVRLTLAERLRVPFTGRRGGDGPLTISQGTLLCWVTNPAFPTRMVEWPLSLPEGTALADIAAALRILMARHESLRTCYPSALAPGTTASSPAEILPGEPVQRVIRSGELVIDVYAASDSPADDAVLVTELTRLLRAREFDLTAELPLRVAVAMWQDKPRVAVILYSHMAADMAAMVVLDRQFTALVTDPSSRQVGPLGHQPLDQAAEEHSARGVRRMDAAVRGWEAAFRIMPQCLYAVPAADPRRDGGVVSGWLWSRAGALALPHIAARTGASRQLVVFAAVCTMIGWRTGHGTCVLPVLSSNRYQRQLRDYVGSLVQDGITVIDVRAGSMDEVVHRAAAAVLRGNHNSLVEVKTLERTVQQAEHARGITWCRYCTFNDISEFQQAADGGTSADATNAADPATADAADAADAADPDAAERALDQTRFSQLRVPGAEEQLLMLLLNQVDGELIMGATSRDANRVPLGELETLLRGTESLLVAAARGDVGLSRIAELTGVRPVTRGDGWLRVGPSWVELAEVQRLLEDALPVPAAAFAVPTTAVPTTAVPAAAVPTTAVPAATIPAATIPAVAVPEPGSHALVAYLAAGGGIDTPEQAHAACMTTLAGTRGLAPPDGIRYTAIAPGRYVICAAAPADVRDMAAWQRQAVVAAGDGRGGHP
jgi:hypothetical protein